MAQLELRTLESEVFALARAVRNYSEGREDAKRVVALLDMGSRSTTCSILDKGVLKTSHSFRIGGNELTEVVAKSLNIDYNKGEELKIEKGLAPSADGELRNVLNPLVDSIFAETKEVFRHFFKIEGKKVDKVILTGGVSSMPGLKEYCAASLGKPTIILNPFANIAYPKILSGILKKMGPSYSVSVGLALKGLERRK